MREVWDTNVFGVLAVYQAMLPLLRATPGAREAVRVALLGPDGPTGRFTRWENQTIPW
jgi:NAD(P)-dependent dehydrogenase (short-subunit alcohol dehydrogenase family)